MELLHLIDISRDHQEHPAESADGPRSFHALLEDALYAVMCAITALANHNAQTCLDIRPPMFTNFRSYLAPGLKSIHPNATTDSQCY